MKKNRKKTNKNLYMIIKEIFYCLSLAWFIFIIMEIIKPGIVIAYINISLISLLWIIIFIIYIFLDNKKTDFKSVL